MDSTLRPQLMEFSGVWMTQYLSNNWENIQNFKARADDILIATYPKAGTTWVSYIIELLQFGQTSIPLRQKVPYLEFSTSLPKTASKASSVSYIGTDMADRLLTSPRLIKTHLPIQLVPKSFWEQNCRVIYVGRNAKDNVVSYFHFERMTMVHPEPGDWNSYLQRFMEGKMVYGSWYDHVNGWWKKKQTYSNLHYMFYEDLIEVIDVFLEFAMDTGREIDKLCCFLGLSSSVEEKEKIREEVQFKNMKMNNMVNYSTSPFMDFNISRFMRKGKVGDWKNHFTLAQSEEFDEDYKRQMKDSTLTFCTEM